MSKEGNVKVKISPGKVEELSEKYGLTREALGEVINSVQVTVPEEPTSISDAQLFKKISGGEFTMVDYLMYSDMMDRREDRRLRREGGTQPQVTPDTISKAIIVAMKEIGLVPDKAKTGSEDVKEVIGEAIEAQVKPIYELVGKIEKKLLKEEEDQRLKIAIEGAVKPIKDQLEKTEDKLGALKEESGKQPPKTELETTKATLQTLSEIDSLRGKGESPVPPGTPPTTQVHIKALDKGEKVFTKGMGDVKDTLSELIQWQTERERRAYGKTQPKLADLSSKERKETLEQVLQKS